MSTLPMLDPAILAAGGGAQDASCLFVALDGQAPWTGLAALPPVPVFGIGSGAGAELVDAVVPDRKAAQALHTAITEHPQAAAVLVQLLRLLPQLSAQHGLVAESLAYGVLQGGSEHRRWLEARAAAPALHDQRPVRCERDGAVLHVTMDHAASGNAIDRTMRDALFEAFSLAAIDTSIGRVMLRGQGKAFSLGAELAEFGTTRDPAVAHAIRMQTLPALPLSRIAERLTVHVQGACIGAGLEMAAWAQRLTASPRAWFQLPELAMGLIPGAGGCVALTWRIGRQQTAALVLSGRRLSARQALAIGLVDAIVDDPPLDPGGERADS